MPTDAQAQDAIVCIQTGKNIADANRLRMIDSPTYFLKSTDEMLDLFEDLPQAVKNSVGVAQKANITIALNKVAFPKYKVPDKKSADEYLKELRYFK